MNPGYIKNSVADKTLNEFSYRPISLNKEPYFDLKSLNYNKNWEHIVKPNEIKPNQIAYLKSHPASRCLDSILIKNKAVKDLANTWFPFNLISDWEIGYQHYMYNHKVYWWEPGRVMQGSETGLFTSAVKI